MKIAFRRQRDKTPLTQSQILRACHRFQRGPNFLSFCLTNNYEKKPEVKRGMVVARLSSISTPAKITDPLRYAKAAESPGNRACRQCTSEQNPSSTNNPPSAGGEAVCSRQAQRTPMWVVAFFFFFKAVWGWGLGRVD